MTTAVVTGAGSGIGAATAAVLARERMSVVCADLDLAAAERVAAALPVAAAVEVDVRDESACERMAATALERFGSVDVLVACAGIEEQGQGDALALASFERVVGVNLTGSFLSARAAARVMIAQGRGGRIVLIGSINSTIALPGQAAYAASKGGVLMLGRALAVDWAAHDIGVNIVGPGVTDTPMSAASLADPERRERLLSHVPLRRAARPDEIAEVIAFLAGGRSSYMTGSFVPVDGGWLATG
ncbi:SDR family oxidoreductase [soil metagenome]|jgi:NAD(P)-dependent dehydrogenase (short-subunit alcohol dehydrogenase family)|nr:SDR family oxidoreductase [Euzebyaceae bacterium]